MFSYQNVQPPKARKVCSNRIYCHTYFVVWVVQDYIFLCLAPGLNDGQTCAGPAITVQYCKDRSQLAKIFKNQTKEVFFKFQNRYQNIMRKYEI